MPNGLKTAGRNARGVVTNNALRLPDWDILAIEELDGVTEITARYPILPEACPKCGVVGRLYRHGTAPVDYRDMPYGSRTLIHAEVQRLRCRECGETSMQPLPHMDERRRMTKRCIEHIERQSVRRTFRDISRDFDVDEKTIRSIGTPYLLREAAKHTFEPPTLLGIDETGLAGRGRGIFTDLSTGRALGIVPTCTKPDMDRWLAQLDPSTVEIVAMDMTRSYCNLARARFPRAAVVMDKFHVLAKIDEQFKKVRSKARSVAHGGDGKNPRRNVNLLRKRAHRLNPMQEMEVDGIAKNSPLTTGPGYYAKEAFHNIYTAKNRKQAETMFAEWRDGLDELPPIVGKLYRPVARMVENWREEIFAYFDYPATNAMTENRNNLIKELNRAGRGYSFEVIRAKGLLMGPLGKWRKCGCCQGDYPESSFRNIADLPRGNSKFIRQLRTAWAEIEREYGNSTCVNCHHLLHHFPWEWAEGVPSHPDSIGFTVEEIRAMPKGIESVKDKIGLRPFHIIGGIFGNQ